MAIENKYGEVTVTGKQFLPGEPLFIFRATDPITPDVLDAYYDEAKSRGCCQAFLESIISRRREIVMWQINNAHLVKHKPD